MEKFAFIIHPINIKTDVSRKWPLVGKVLGERQINFFSRFFPPVYISEITGITRPRASGRPRVGVDRHASCQLLRGHDAALDMHRGDLPGHMLELRRREQRLPGPILQHVHEQGPAALVEL